MIQITIEMKREIAKLCGIGTHAVRRALQANGHPLARHHRHALVERFGAEVADRLCPVRERAGASPRKQPAGADILERIGKLEASLAGMEASLAELAASFAELAAESEQRASVIEDRIEALECR